MVNPDRVAFTVIGRPIYWYGILIAIGVLAAIMICNRNAKIKGWKQDDILDFCIFAIPSGVIGARLYYVIFEWQMFKGDLASIIRIWDGGVAIYGAIIGGFIAAIVFCKVKKHLLRDLLDIVAPGLVLAQAIGRWGNFFNQEAYGIQVTNAAHMWFPLAVKIDATDTIHYATFFYESMWCLLVFALLMIFYRRFKRKGDVFITYAMLYSFERMFVESLRTDSLWLVPGRIRVSQLVSVLVFAICATYFIYNFFKAKQNPPVSQTVSQNADEDELPSGNGNDVNGVSIREEIAADSGMNEQAKTSDASKGLIGEGQPAVGDEKAVVSSDDLKIEAENQE